MLLHFILHYTTRLYFILHYTQLLSYTSKSKRYPFSFNELNEMIDLDLACK